MSTTKLNGMRRRLYTGLGVLAILGMICAFYYFYVSNKEQKLQERNFRILHRIEENFERRLRDYRQMFISSINVCESCLDERGRVSVEKLSEGLKIKEIVRVAWDSGHHPVDWRLLSNGKNSHIDFYFSNSDVRHDADTDFHFKISADVQGILTSVLRYDVFPSYILSGKKGTAYNNCKEICEVTLSDSVMKNDNVSGLKIGSGNFFVFSHPFSGAGEGELVLSGIVSAEQYTDEKFSVPGNFLLIVFLLLLVILLAFPFIKSFLVSAEETLDLTDVLLALLSLFVLCYMFVFIHMNIFTVPIDAERKQAMLKTTSDSIGHAFLKELGQMRQQLDYYDGIYSQHFDTGGKSKTAIPAGQRLNRGFYPDFYRVFWLNRDGIQVKELEKQRDTFFDLSANSERDYHDRGYFKAANNDALWFPDRPDEEKLYIEPVYSRIDGSFRAVMSKKGRDTPLVAVLSSEMHSVINTILPREVDFCLLDHKGDIMFTSTGSEHINENFLEECNYSREISSALYAREHTFFEREFMGRDCSFYLSPVEGLPLYLVTLTNNEFGGSTQLQVCIYTSLFIVAILIVFSLVILFLVLLMRQNKNKLIRRPFLDLSLLYPASHYVYRDFGGILFNFVLMAAVVICGYISRDQPLILIVLLLINASGTTAAFCYARLDLLPSRRAFFWVATMVFFGVCNIILLNRGAWDHKASFISLICYEALIIAVIWQLRLLRYYEKDFSHFAKVNANDAYRQISAQTEALRQTNLQTFMIRLQERFSRYMDVRIHHRLKFYNQFAFMLVTWFTLIALVPTVFVYRYIYKNEVENRIKSAQIDIARKWFQQGVYNKEGNPKFVKPLDSARAQAYLYGYYQTRLVPGRDCTEGPDQQETEFNKMLNRFRFSMKPQHDLANAVYPGVSDSTIRFCKEDGLLKLGYRNLLNHPESQGKNLVTVQSRLPGFPLPSVSLRTVLPLAFFLFAPLLFLALLFSVINFFLKRFFLFDALPPDTLTDDDYFSKLIYEKYHAGSFKLIILGVTSSGKRDMIKRAVAFIYDKEHANKVNDDTKNRERAEFVATHLHVYDLAEIDQAMHALSKKKFSKGDVLVLQHFEYNLAEQETNDKKFRLISAIFRMCEQTGAHLVILSNIHPSVFLNNQKAKTESVSFKAEDYIDKQHYYNWTGLLSGFEIHIKAYPKQVPEDTDGSLSESFESYNHTKSNYMLYLSIWNSLDRIEKFVLYDLATDSLVNYRNKASLYSLYAKGLVVLNDMPALMNEEFRTFILTEIIEEDVELEKQQSGSSSAWNTFKIPFLVILIAILMFVFITQQETFNKLMAGLVAVAGSLPILIKLLSFTQEKKAS